jgi:WD40 repeat protein
VYALAFSRDGHWLFSGGQDGTVRRWDVAAHREVGQPLQHELPVYFVDVAPDARTIATACTDHYLRLWDVTSGRVRKLRYSPGEPVMAPVFSPDGRLLAFGTGNNIRVWDLPAEQEKTVLRGSAGRIINLRFLQDGRQLVSANEFDSPMLWDIDRPEKVITLKGFREGVRSMAVCSAPPWLAVGSVDESGPERPGEVIVFDLATQQRLLPPLEHPQGVNSVSLRGDGSLLATGCSDGSVRIFTLPDGRLIHTLTNAVANRTGNLIFSPDGQSLVTCGGAPAQLAAWNTATWQARTLLRDPPANHAGFAFSADGSLLVTPMGDNFAIVWNMPSGTTNHLKFNSYVGEAALSSDGSMLALALGFFDIALLKVGTWERLGTLKGHEHVIHWTAFAPDGKILASVAIDGSVRLWSLPGCDEVAVLYDHLDATGTVAFTPDGQWLISGSSDKTVKLRRLPSFEEIQTAESAAAARRKHP